MTIFSLSQKYITSVIWTTTLTWNNGIFKTSSCKMMRLSFPLYFICRFSNIYLRLKIQMISSHAHLLSAFLYIPLNAYNHKSYLCLYSRVEKRRFGQTKGKGERKAYREITKSNRVFRWKFDFEMSKKYMIFCKAPAILLSAEMLADLKQVSFHQCKF